MENKSTKFKSGDNVVVLNGFKYAPTGATGVVKFYDNQDDELVWVELNELTEHGTKISKHVLFACYESALGIENKYSLNISTHKKVCELFREVIDSYVNQTAVTNTMANKAIELLKIHNYSE